MSDNTALIGLPLVAAALLAMSVACSGVRERAAVPTSAAGGTTSDGGQLLPNELRLVKGPVSPDGTQAILGTPDLGVGENRVAFALTSQVGLIKSPAAAVSSYFSSSESAGGELKQTALAVFHLWPYGTRGTYVTSLVFDRPGVWELDIVAADVDGASRQAKLSFQVREAASAPVVGAPAIPSNNRTLVEVKRLSQLTTGSLHDAELYQTTIANAVSSGLPTVVVMASPAFCISPVCGPQVEVLQELKNRYRGRAHFIHVDFYDNPEEIQGDLANARLSPTVVEWRLTSGEWSFVIDRHGIVSARFESFATLEELEQALLRVL